MSAIMPMRAEPVAVVTRATESGAMKDVARPERA